MRVMILAFLVATVVMLALLYFMPKPCYPVNLYDDGIETGEPIEISWWSI